MNRRLRSCSALRRRGPLLRGSPVGVSPTRSFTVDKMELRVATACARRWGCVAESGTLEDRVGTDAGTARQEVGMTGIEIVAEEETYRLITDGGDRFAVIEARAG